MPKDIRDARATLSDAINELKEGDAFGRSIAATLANLVRVIERQDRELGTLRADTQELENSIVRKR